MNRPTLLRAGIVGVGRLGREHVRVWASLPGVELSGVYDRNPERGEEQAHKYGTTQSPSLPSLIESSDVISVVTSTEAHFDVARQVVEAGVACFVEKPICADAADAEALVALAAERSVPLGVGHIERYNPAVLALGDALVVPRFVEAHRLAEFSPRGTDVAVVYDLMIHDIDLLLRFMGTEPEDVRAAGAAVVSDELDICNARLEFPGGAVANLTASRISTFRLRRFRMFAESLYVALDLQEKRLERYRLYPSAEALAEAGAAGTRLPFGNRGQMLAVERAEPEGVEMLVAELADFAQAVREKRTPPVDGHAGLRALRVAERIQRQALERLAHAQLS
jgi:predicted dehydrogenase